MICFLMQLISGHLRQKQLFDDLFSNIFEQLNFSELKINLKLTS
jgi:hypothetical protein